MDEFDLLAQELADRDAAKAAEARRAAAPVLIRKSARFALARKPDKPAQATPAEVSAKLDGILAKALDLAAAGRMSVVQVAKLEARAEKTRIAVLARRAR